jgi:DNA-binding NarL/FixJ family response regulator
LKTNQPPGVKYSEAEGLMLVAERLAEIRVLRRQGTWVRKIARMLEVAHNTVRHHLRGEGLPHKRKAGLLAPSAKDVRL